MNIIYTALSFVFLMLTLLFGSYLNDMRVFDEKGNITPNAIKITIYTALSFILTGVFGFLV